MGCGGCRAATMDDAVGGGGVVGKETSCTESLRDDVSALTVLMEGDGGVAVSEETTVVAVAPRLSARYDR